MHVVSRLWPCLILVALASTGVGGAVPAQPDAGWGRLVTGRLGNGVRYAILPRRNGEPGAALLMRNEGGFIAERRPGERGLAHLIEHVVFHSPTVGSPDDRDHFTRLGLQVTLPAPTVATTSWRESNYFLATRTLDPAGIDTMLGLLREAASDMTLRADTVDAERASVMREMADKRLGNAIYADYIAAIAPGSPTDVIEAQNSDDVPTASVATIRGLYHRLYRPETMMIVIVGNVDPARMKALVARRFGDWRGAGPAPARVPAPRFSAERVAPISVSTRQDGRRSAMMTVVSPTAAPPRTRDAQADAMLIEMLVTRAIGDRLASAQQGRAGIVVENGEQGHRLIIVWDDFAEGKWRPAVAGLRRQVCALGDGGFADAEWAAAKRAVVAALERRAREMGGIANVDIAKDLSHALADDRALIAPDLLLRRARRVLPGIGARDGSAWWRRQWSAGPAHLRVEAPELASVAAPLVAVRAVADEAAPGCRLRR